MRVNDRCDKMKALTGTCIMYGMVENLMFYEHSYYVIVCNWCRSEEVAVQHL